MTQKMKHARKKSPNALLVAAIVVAASLALAIAGNIALDGILGMNSAGIWYNKYWIGAFFAVFLVIGIAIIFHARFAKRPDILFLLIILSTTLLFTWSLSTWQLSWDDGIHFRNVIRYMNLGSESVLDMASAAIAQTIDPLTDGNTYLSEGHNLATTYLRESVLNQLSSDQSDLAFAAANFSPTAIEYYPCAIVMWFCNLVGLSFSATFTLSKIPCAVIYSFVAFFGMRQLKYGKMVYAVVALLPTSIFLASNYSYSYWTYSLLLFALASFAGMLQRDEQPSIIRTVLMLGAFFLACLPRIVYFPLILVCLTLPRRKFENPVNSRVFRASVIGTCMLTAAVFFLPVISGGLGEGDARGGGDVDPTRQLQYILGNPLDYMSLVFGYLTPPLEFEGGAPDSEGYSLVSGFLPPMGLSGWLTNYGYLPRPSIVFAIIVVAMLIFTALTDSKPESGYGFSPAIVSWAVSIAAMLMIITYMYLGFTNVGEDQIRGVQRRYMIPMIYPTLAFIGSRKWVLSGTRIPRSYYNTGVMLAMFLVLMGSWWQSYLFALN